MFMRDIRFSFRMLAKNPWLSALIISIFALGIGSSVAMFTILNSVLLRPLPYPESERLFTIREIIPQWSKFYASLPVNLPNFQIWQKQSRSFDGIAIAEPITANMTGRGEAQRLNGVRSSANLFDVLRVSVALGRNFSKGADDPGRGFEVVLTDRFWKSTFHADRSVVGKTVTLNEEAYAVVGVLPAAFYFPVYFGPMTGFPEQIDFFQALNGPKFYETALIGEFDFTGITRLKSNVSKRAALAELNVIQAGIARTANQKLDLAADLIPLAEATTGNSKRQLYFLFAFVAGLLLIGCINIVNLLLARSPGRMREAAIRLALCGTPRQVFRQFLTENLMFGLVGGALGIVLAYNALDSIIAFAPRGIPRLNEIHVDSRVVLFAIVLSLGTGAVAGLLPAWRMSRTKPFEALKSGGTATTENIGTSFVRKVLVAVQVGLCTVLLLLAGLLTSSFINVLHVDTGFTAQSVLAADVELPPLTYSKPEARLRFYDQVAEGIQSLPGVVSAAWISILPLEGEGSVTDVGLPENADAGNNPKANYRVVSPQYFHTMGIPILAGRDFSENDRTRHVVIVSKSVADRFWPGGNAVGKLCVSKWGGKQVNEVIGVAGDIRTVNLDQPPLLMVYTPVMFARAALDAPQAGSIVIRTKSDPISLAAGTRRVIRKADIGVPIVSLQPMRTLISKSLSSRRFQMMLALVFAFFALVLALLGVFGVVAYSTEQRRREIGIRVAMGATATRLRNMILRQGMGPVFIGLVGGLVAGFFAARLVTSLLFEVRYFDTATMVSVLTVIVISSACACWIPARRAMRVDPIITLRYE